MESDNTKLELYIADRLQNIEALLRVIVTEQVPSRERLNKLLGTEKTHRVPTYKPEQSR